MGAPDSMDARDIEISWSANIRTGWRRWSEGTFVAPNLAVTWGTNMNNMTMKALVPNPFISHSLIYFGYTLHSLIRSPAGTLCGNYGDGNFPNVASCSDSNLQSSAHFLGLTLHALTYNFVKTAGSGDSTPKQFLDSIVVSISCTDISCIVHIR